MMWTYRVFRDCQDRYSIREVFYEGDRTMIDYSKEPVAVVGASFEELLQLVAWFREAFDLPVLSLEEIDAQIGDQKTKPALDRTQNVSLQDVIAELEADFFSVSAIPNSIEDRDAGDRL